MKVLHFYRTYLPDTIGGAEQVINQLARSTKAYGVETEVLTLSPSHRPSTVEVDGHMVHRVPLDIEIASTGFSLAAFRRFADLTEKADVVHYHFPWPFMDVVHFATRLRKPAVVTYHSDIIRQRYLLKLYGPLRERFLSSVDSIVATSPNYLATSPTLKSFCEKVSVIPIGLDKNTYALSCADQTARWEAVFGGRFFLFVGVLRYYKGLHLLIEAAQGLDYPIVIVGAGPIERELRQQAAELGLLNIHFLGFVSEEDKVALLKLCYAVVFPSHLRSEAFGISLLEGAMFGKPMISSEIGTGTTFINIDGETGVVIPPGDADALREAMRELWNHPERAADMGQRAEARYWQHFTADRMAEAYSKLYRQLVSR